MKQLDLFIKESGIELTLAGEYIVNNNQGLYLILNMNDLSELTILKILTDIKENIRYAGGLKSFEKFADVWQEQEQIIEKNLKEMKGYYEE